MTQFTTKQRAYVEARANGHNITQAALHAGYSPAGANRQGSLLEKQPAIKKAIAAAKRKASTLRDHMEVHVGTRGKVDGIGDDDRPRMKSKYGSSLELLQHTYNNPRMPDSVRLRAAEQALPYEHGRIGEKGKKETAKEKAHAIATGGGSQRRGKFQTKEPPKLTSIQGGKQ